ncbi:hypothetical protein [Leptodesmis sp.]|uniref:hypothetical protein n=1 Tax=Leptodesmis sp. TaxID=3100501 RepID=UPI00405351A4
MYWSAYDPALENADYAQTLWDEVPGLENVTQVIGAVPYEVAEGTSFIYLFALTQVKGATQLGFIKYDLENPKSQRWDSEPTILEDIPESATQFTAVVKQYNRVGDQTNKTKTQPHLAIRLPNGRIYDRYLNQEGSEWAEGEWKPLVGHAIGSTFHQLCGMVEISEKDFCLIASKAPTSCKLFYHIFGELDDGLWRSLPTKQNNPNNICIYEGAFAFHPDYAAPCALPLRIFGGTR